MLKSISKLRLKKKSSSSSSTSSLASVVTNSKTSLAVISEQNGRAKSTHLSPKRPRDGQGQGPSTPLIDSPQKKAKLDVSEKSGELPMSHKYGRYHVQDVKKHLQEIRLQLSLEDKEDKEKLVCVLRGSWMTTVVQPGDVVHVLVERKKDHDDDISFLIDDFNGMLVVNPDHLVSGTSVVSTLFCMRKAVLNEQFKGLEGGSKTMFIGTLVHELLQASLKAQAQTLGQVEAHLETILATRSIMTDLLNLKISVEEARKEVEPFLPHIHFFTERSCEFFQTFFHFFKPQMFFCF